MTKSKSQVLKEKLQILLGGYCWSQDGGNGGYSFENVWSFIEQALSSQEKRLTKEMREKIEEGLYDWYAKRQIEYGRSAWTDDYFSQGDTLSGTIIPIIRKSLLDSSKKC